MLTSPLFKGDFLKIDLCDSHNNQKALTRSQWVSAFFGISVFSEKVKLPPEGADGSFSKGIFMKKNF